MGFNINNSSHPISVKDEGSSIVTDVDSIDFVGANVVASASGNGVVVTVAGPDNPVTVAEGGTGASTAAGARTNLGLGSMALQAASSVAITGGTIDGATYSGTWNGTPISLAKGGAAAALIASNGGILYSTATTLAILAGTATANRVLLSGSSTTPAWSTATYPATTTVSRLLYSSSTNVIADLATANSGVLVTNSSGVPSIATDIPTGVTIGTAYVYRVGGTDVAVTDGGTGASDAGTARANLGASASGSNSDITALTAITAITIDPDGNRTVAMGRDSVGGLPGNTLTIRAGSPKIGETNQAGGNLILQSGTSTGNTASSILLQAVVAGSSGTGDNAAGTIVTISGASMTLAAGKTLLFTGSSSGVVTLTTAAAAGTWSMTLPTSAGTSGYYLQTDGNGVTSWAAGGSGAPTNATYITQVAESGLSAEQALANLTSGIVTVATGTGILSSIAYTNTTFTPTVTLVGGAGNTTPVYSTNTGRYTQIGTRVFVDVYLTGDGGDEGAGTGVFTIALPVTANASHPTSLFPVGYALNGMTEFELYGQVAGSATTISLAYFTSISGQSDFTGNNQGSTTRTVRIKFSYEA